MKVDISTIDRNNFMVHPHKVGDHEVWLVQPIHIGATWTADNDIFRSSVWDKDGNPVSLSFKKFFNWGEQPQLCPPPESLVGAHLLEKIDGSTLIFSRYKGHTVIRTRGTVDARKQENGYEIDMLCAKYSRFVAELEKHENTTESYIFEWTSPSNRIVLNYGVEPDMVLTGIVFHSDYTYATQELLNATASTFHLRRPQSFAYDSVDEMKSSVEAFRGMEGVCVYYHNDQKILKVKGAHYLLCHRMKSEVSSIEKVIDLWVAQGKPTYQEFFDYVAKTFDYELAVMCRGHISNICDGWKQVQLILDGFRVFAAKVRNLTRREAAEKILQAYGQTNRASYVFALLDNKPLDDEKVKKLLYQVLKSS